MRFGVGGDISSVCVYPECAPLLPCVHQPHTLWKGRAGKILLTPLPNSYAHSTRIHSSLTFSLFSLSVLSPT